MVYTAGQNRLEYFQKSSSNGKPYCEMTQFENAFLIGLLGKYRPSNILEVGISAGATTTMILDFLKQAKLTSLDIREQWYQDSGKLTGFLAMENHGANPNWQIKTGVYLPEYLAERNEKFDFCILDTAHSLPGEVLDFLAVLPFMVDGGIVVVHDYHWHLYAPLGDDLGKKSYATKVLLDSAVGTKIICRDPERPSVLPNIAGMIIEENTRQYVNNVFASLSMPWQYALSEREYGVYLEWFKRHYGLELAEVFGLARNLATQRLQAVQTAELLSNVVALEKYIREAKAKNVGSDYLKSMAEAIMKVAVDSYNQNLNLSAACLAGLAAFCGVPLKNLRLLEAASLARENKLFGALAAINQELKDFPQGNSQAVELMLRTVQSLFSPTNRV